MPHLAKNPHSTFAYEVNHADRTDMLYAFIRVVNALKSQGGELPRDGLSPAEALAHAYIQEETGGRALCSGDSLLSFVDAQAASQALEQAYAQVLASTALPMAAAVGADCGLARPSVADAALDYSDASAPLRNHTLCADKARPRMDDTPFEALDSPVTLATAPTPAPGYAAHCADVVDALLSVCAGPLTLAVGA